MIAHFVARIKTRVEMMDIKEESLRRALDATACRELPPPYREGAGFWVKAIVLVRKRNNTQSYALAERRADGLIRYTRDFGLMSQIAGLVSVHPYMYYDEERYRLHTQSREGKLRALASYFGKDREAEVLCADDAQLALLEREMGIRRQLESRPEDIADDAARCASPTEPLAAGAEVMLTDSGPEAMVTLAKARGRKRQARGLD